MSALIGAGTFTLLLGIVPWLWLAYIACFGVGVFGNIAIISALTVLQSITPNYMRGRIMGLNAMINTVFSVTVYFGIWMLPNADRGIVIVLWVIGPMLILGGIFGLTRYLIHGPMPNRKANAFRRIFRLYCFSWHRLTIQGKHHIPRDGPVIIVSNHTTAMDPFLIQSSSIRMVRWLMLTSHRAKFMEPLWRAIDPICLEHDKSTDTAEPGVKQIRQIVRELKKGDVVGIFPEGHLQYDNRDLKEFQNGAAVMARLSKATIVPCWIQGTVLSKSMAAHILKPSRSSITYGPPFKPEKGMSVEALTQEIHKRVTALSGT